MKVICVSVALSSLVLSSVLGYLPISEEHKKMIEDCKQENQLTEEPADGLTKQNNCFAACMMKKNGFLHEDGTIDKSKLIEKAEQIFPNGIPEKAKSALGECAEIVGKIDDPCEVAYSLVQCKKDELAKLNIDITDFM